MGNQRKSDETIDNYVVRPAETQEARENQMIALATQVAEQQLRDGTASAMVITHYLKLGTEKAKLERRQLEADIELKKAKVEAIESTQRIEELYSKAIDAIKLYSGVGEDYDLE